VVGEREVEDAAACVEGNVDDAGSLAGAWRLSRQTRLTQQASKNRPRNQHKTIMVALDLSDAFCRIRGPRVAALPHLKSAGTREG
jgi:hypothetical protein